MDSEESAFRPERDETDEGLRNERARTDDELASRVRAIETKAAVEVDRAHQEVADAVGTMLESVGAAAPTLQPARTTVDEGAKRDEARAEAVAHENLHDESDTLLRMLPIERERTDQLLLTERVRSDEAVSNRDDFLSIVSHDLRSLLNTVAMGAQIIEQDASRNGADDPTARMAQRIVRTAGRMNRLVGDLMDVSSLESGRLHVELTRGDVTALVIDALAASKHAAVAKGISLEPGQLEDSLVANFDHDRILQVLANLIENAIKFTPPAGMIFVGSSRVGGEARISVRDNGPGIDEAQTEAVFERFWQVGNRDRRGLGLGLYISRGIVEAHGGKIWAESKLGEGSTFLFTLGTQVPEPASVAAGRDPSSAKASSYDGRARTAAGQ